MQTIALSPRPGTVLLGFSEPTEPWLPPSVTVRCGGASITGYAERVTDVEVLVQALEDLPPLPGECELVFGYPEGEVTARGIVLGANHDSRLLRISIERLLGSGKALLAAAILEEDPAVSALSHN